MKRAPTKARRAFAAGLATGLLAGFLVGLAVAWRVSERPAALLSVQPAQSETLLGPLALRLKPPRLPIVVEVTAYSLTPDQTDSTPFISRCGRIAPEGVPAGGGRYLPAVAVSQDLLAVADCGTRVRLNGREYISWDTMHPRWQRRVDVLMPSRGEALRWGVRRGLFEAVRWQHKSNRAK